MKEKKLSWFERLLIWRALVAYGRDHGISHAVAGQFADAWIALKNHRAE